MAQSAAARVQACHLALAPALPLNCRKIARLAGDAASVGGCLLAYPARLGLGNAQMLPILSKCLGVGTGDDCGNMKNR